MPEQPRPKLPQEREYWDELTRRIRDDARGPLAGYRSGDDVPLYDSLSRLAPWLIAASIAGTALLLFAMPRSKPSAAAVWIEEALAPSETAGTLVSSAEPPTIDVLMAQFPPVSDEEAGR